MNIVKAKKKKLNCVNQKLKKNYVTTTGVKEVTLLQFYIIYYLT